MVAPSPSIPSITELRACIASIAVTSHVTLPFGITDAIYLSDAMIPVLKRADESLLDDYQEKALARIWKAERFSWYLTKLMHRFPEDGPFEHRMQCAELNYVATSAAMQTAIAENYVGLPL